METHYILITDIQWDCDAEMAGLPSSVLVTVTSQDDYEWLMSEEGPADYLSDEYGWAVRSLNVEEVDEEEAFQRDVEARTALGPQYRDAGMVDPGWL